MDTTAVQVTVETVSPSAQWLALAIIAGGSASIGAAGCLLGELVRRRYLLQEMPGRAFWKWAIVIGITIPLLNGLTITLFSSAESEDLVMFSTTNIGLVVGAGVAMYAFTWLFVYRWLVYVGIRFPTGSNGSDDDGESGSR
jgi:hypothetical protein